MVALVRDRDLSLTVCPSFSGRIDTAAGQVDVARGMRDADLRVTINPDDPAYMGSEYLNAVMLREQRAASLTRQELVGSQRNAFGAAWLPTADRARYLAKLDMFARSQGLA